MLDCAPRREVLPSILTPAPAYPVERSSSEKVSSFSSSVVVSLTLMAALVRLFAGEVTERKCKGGLDAAAREEEDDSGARVGARLNAAGFILLPGCNRCS